MINNNPFDLLTTVEYGGCSAKLDPNKLGELLSDLPLLKNNNILVDIETHDDAGVYKINEELALIVTTDFFPPVCSDAKTFGEIAAANSLSDIYAMGGTPLLTLNITLFPSNKIPLTVLHDILLGAQEIVNSAGAFTMGGHTIEDYPPKFGLAVVGTVNPKKLITNSGAKVGQKIILTKPLGIGVLIAAQRLQISQAEAYQAAITEMKTLNKAAAEVMCKYAVTGATDITGFGLLGHAMQLAQASNVSLQIDHNHLPHLPQSLELLDMGCIPGAVFRNLTFVTKSLYTASTCPLPYKHLACDAQTSGGIFMAVDADKADALLAELHNHTPHTQASIIGEVIPQQGKAIYLL